MLKINEWEEPPWVPHEWDDTAAPPRNGQPPQGREKSTSPATQLVERIAQALKAQPRAPAAVHFFDGEGLCWIRVGFAEDQPLAPLLVRDIGLAIDACLPARRRPLYFQALRAHDMLFFLEGGAQNKSGMPPGSFGAPLAQVLQDWELAPVTPARPRRVRSAAR